MSRLSALGGEPIRKEPYPKWLVHDEREVEAVTRVIESGNWGGYPYPGPETATFLRELLAMQGGQYAIACVNGTVTVEIACRAAAIGWSDEVIIPAYTFQATVAAPMAAGAIPVIVDVDPQSDCISPQAVEAAITDKTRAIIPVLLGAQMADHADEALSELPGIRVLRRDPRHTIRSFYRYVLAIDPEAFGAEHDAVCYALDWEGIPCWVGYEAMHHNGMFQPQLSRLPVPSAFPERFRLDEMHFPVAERACEQEAVWLSSPILPISRKLVLSCVTFSALLWYNRSRGSWKSYAVSRSRTKSETRLLGLGQNPRHACSCAGCWMKSDTQLPSGGQSPPPRALPSARYTCHR